MSKGQIYRELEKLLRYLQNLIKLDNELRREIREINNFRKKTPRRIYRIKNHSSWTSIPREIKERNEEKKIDCEERENDQIT